MKNIKKLKEEIVKISLDESTTYEEFQILATLNGIINKGLEEWEKKEQEIWRDKGKASSEKFKKLFEDGHYKFITKP